jgi:hypothetical protein
MMAMVLRRLSAAAAACVMLALPLAGTGCDGVAGAKTANVSPGDLPKDGNWQGVWYSELYGYLHLVKKGNSEVRGKWERPHKDKWGEMKGEIQGDLMRFEWNEYTKGLVGPNAKKSGKGYFKYKRPAGDNVDDKIEGEIGLVQDEVGDPWEAVHQRRVEPDLSSIGGTGAMDLGGGDWDKDNKEDGKPEPPKGPR